MHYNQQFYDIFVYFKRTEHISIVNDFSEFRLSGITIKQMYSEQ